MHPRGRHEGCFARSRQQLPIASDQLAPLRLAPDKRAHAARRTKASRPAQDVLEIAEQDQMRAAVFVGTVPESAMAGVVGKAEEFRHGLPDIDVEHAHLIEQEDFQRNERVDLFVGRFGKSNLLS